MLKQFYINNSVKEKEEFISLKKHTWINLQKRLLSWPLCKEKIKRTHNTIYNVDVHEMRRNLK